MQGLCTSPSKAYLDLQHRLAKLALPSNQIVEAGVTEMEGTNAKQARRGAGKRVSIYPWARSAFEIDSNPPTDNWIHSGPRDLSTTPL